MDFYGGVYEKRTCQRDERSNGDHDESEPAGMLYASGKGSVSGNIVLKEVCDAVRNINSNQAVWLGIKGRTAISL